MFDQRRVGLMAETRQTGAEAGRRVPTFDGVFEGAEKQTTTPNRVRKQILSARLSDEMVEAKLIAKIEMWRGQHRARCMDIPGLQERYGINKAFAQMLAGALLGLRA